MYARCVGLRASVSGARCRALSAALVGGAIETPLLRSGPLSARLGCEVFFKMDCAQPSGSFKLRGIGAAVAAAVARGAQGVVSSSGGNAGLATAHAARALGVSCAVVLPTTTPAAVRSRLEDDYGASVTVAGAVWDEAHAAAEALGAATDAAVIHPFEGADTIAGHASVVAEIDAQLRAAGAPPLDAVVTCVGGGGLLAGILAGLGPDRPDVAVIAAETAGADSFAHSLAHGSARARPGGIESIAKSLGATTPSASAVDAALARGNVAPYVVTDADAVAACVAFLNERRVLVEPACGAALAAVYGESVPAALENRRCVVVEVCGGAVVDLPQLLAWAEEFGIGAHSTGFS